MTTLRRGASPLVVATALAVLPVLIGGCNADCTGTRIEVTAVKVVSRSTPITLSGRLLGGDKPLSDIKLNFYIAIAGQQGRHVPTGSATTNGDGRASVRLAGGIAGALLPGDQEKGYEVEFKSITDIDGTHYCDVTTDGSFTS